MVPDAGWNSDPGNSAARGMSPGADCWSKHPDTTVLSLDTGHERDYGEGRAYRAYFSTDELMYQVPERDKRLKNKAEVLGILLSPTSREGGEESLAVSSRFLQKNRVFQTELAGRRLTILTTPAGANRVFRTGDRRFERLLADDQAVDDSGRTWKVTEDALVGGSVRWRRARSPASHPRRSPRSDGPTGSQPRHRTAMAGRLRHAAGRSPRRRARCTASSRLRAPSLAKILWM